MTASLTLDSVGNLAWEILELKDASVGFLLKKLGACKAPACWRLQEQVELALASLLRGSSGLHLDALS